MSILCSMVGATFSVAAAAEIIRRKKGITAIGNAQIDTAQSKFGGASALFDGAGDYLLVSNAVAFGTDPWTIEYQVRFNSVASFPIMFDTRTDNSDLTGYSDYINGSGKLVVFINSADRIVSTTTFTTGVWYHIAIVRDSSNNVKLYVNGTNEGSTYSHNANMTSVRNLVGTNANQANFLNGWMDEIRISNTARYTSNFTAPTAPFVNDNNTLLLIHADGTDATTYFEDDNGVRAPIPLIGSGVTVSTTQSKFGGSSVYFDGTGTDNITAGTTAGNLGSGNFTVEFWLYNVSNANGTTNGVINKRVADNWGTGTWGVRWTDNGSSRTMVWENIIPNNVTTVTSSSNVWSYNTWSHWAFVRNSGTLTIYHNGTNVGSAANSIDFTNSHPIRIGWWGVGSNCTNSYIDEIRISNTARYTSNFTSPTAPFANDSNTLFLMHGDGTNASTVFRDDNGARTPIGCGLSDSATISTTQSQFGGSSLSLAGVPSRLDIYGMTNIGTNDFTWECWIRIPASTGLVQFGGISNGDFYVNITTSAFQFGRQNVAWDAQSTLYPTANTFTHLAIVRSGTSLRLYVNGVQGASATNSQSYVWANAGNLYTRLTGGPSGSCFVDEFRISNTARYTSAFTPPTAPFSNDANTVLLIHADGTNGSTVIFDDNGQVPQTP